MTPKNAAKKAANNLIQAFKALRLDDEVVDFDILEPHSYRRAPSDRRFMLDVQCMEAIDRASRMLHQVTVTYPREKAQEALTDIVIAVRDREVPIAAAHAALTQDILNWLNQVSDLGDWKVLHAVRGVQTCEKPFAIGHCQFFQMDQEQFCLWGQRFATGKYEPPREAPVLRTWVEQDGCLLGQAVAVVSVRASDSHHATSEARRIIIESLDLLRYGQVIHGWPPEPVPEFGLAAMSAHGYVQTHSVCISLGKPHFSSNKSIGAGDGAVFEYCNAAPGWQGIEKVLMVDAGARTEMQRRVMLALGWVGQAALASSMSVRLVAFITALETLLIEDSESLGKKRKLSTRVSAFPKLPMARRHVDFSLAEKLYKIRSGCLHAGRTDVEVPDVELAQQAVAQCFSGVLCHVENSECETINDLLSVLSASE